MPQAYIMVGPPGSGKSTLANSIGANAVVCSADHYHIGADQVYHWDPKNVPMAHSACLEKWLSTVRRRELDVVCDNTNTTLVAAAPYVATALAYQYEVMIVHIMTHESDIGVLMQNQKHAVPRETILRMMADIGREWSRRLPSFWSGVTLINIPGYWEKDRSNIKATDATHDYLIKIEEH